MDLRWEDRALEIGPGRGVLLRFLLKASHRVTAVELDLRLRPSLEKNFGGHPGLDLVFDDFMRFDLVDYIHQVSTPVKVVGNVPYSLSSSILFRLFETAQKLMDQGAPRMKSATLMLQREVAQRLCSAPRNKNYGIITVLRALVAEAELLFTVPPTAFIPPPKVYSAVARLNFHSKPLYSITNPQLFSDLVHHVFTQRRKMLKNTLGSWHWINPDWTRVDFDLTRRPEELSTQEFIDLFDKIKPIPNPKGASEIGSTPY
jgi:16S rRNA (adenine1518-N6/adenine1519-N6)-dimethyltransferase